MNDLNDGPLLFQLKNGIHFKKLFFNEVDNSASFGLVIAIFRFYCAGFFTEGSTKLQISVIFIVCLFLRC